MNYIIEIWEKDNIFWYYVFDEAKDTSKFRNKAGEPMNFKCDSFDCARTLQQAEYKAEEAKRKLEDNPNFYLKKAPRLVKREEEDAEKQINSLAEWIRKGKDPLDFCDQQ